jgi:hypothetical protein
MSAYDFKAQASPQSIGATSIPSEETFGTSTLADNRRVSLSSGIVSRAGFTTNTSLAVVNNIAIASGIASSEILLNNNSFGLNTYFTIPSIGLLLRDAALSEPTITLSIGITLSTINSEEIFPSANISNVSYISFSGNGISSLETVGTHTFNTNTFINVDASIISSESLSLNNQFFLYNNIYPISIGSSELLENTNLFGNISGIVLTTGIRSGFSSPESSQLALLGSVQHINLASGIVSKLAFGRRTTFYPPPPSYLRKGFVYGYTAVINNIFVTLERENLLDTITKIPEKITNLQSRSEIINSYIEYKHLLSSNIDVVYSIESEIVQERSVIARQTKYYLESYIKQKHKISSDIYVELNDTFYTVRSGKIN